MSKKFTEYSKFDLSNVNKEVLKKWKDGDIFHKSLEQERDILHSYSTRALHPQTVCRVFTMLSPVRLRIFFAAIKP